MIDIVHRDTGAVLYHAADAESVRDAVEAAVRVGADLTDARLTVADLTDARLTVADLTGARLTGARLTVARLDGAPMVEDLDRRILAAIEQPGCSLDMSWWHTCETTHCMAGWAIHLAGEAGLDLERRIGPSAAGAVIFARSTGRVPDFYATTGQALRDLRARVDEVAS